MRISVFGLGYVGCVSAACFSEAGHEVIGIDLNPLKVEIINAGRSPIVEPGIEKLIAQNRKNKRLSATDDVAQAIAGSDLSLVCVGTPGSASGSLDLSHVKHVAQEIGSALALKTSYHVVAFRSTMLPGTMDETVRPNLEAKSGKKAGKDFGMAVNPEFLREGTSIHDFENPPFTLIGTDDERSRKAMSEIYANVKAPILHLKLREAEMVKYSCNAFHALKVSFANEIGVICKKLEIDSHKVMEVFCKDQKLNLSSYYLKPGFAFGGSCLPKDLRALTYSAKRLDLEAPLLNAILPSNRLQIERVVDMVLATGKRNVAVLGLSFKSGTDDLRESPTVTLIESLIGKGLKLMIHDREVEMARVFGANKDFIEHKIPHISSLLSKDLGEILAQSEVIVIAKNEPEYRVLYSDAKQSKKHTLIDLVRISEDMSHEGYQGICW